jgi:hypothetical protein
VQEPALPENVIRAAQVMRWALERFPEKRKCAAFAVS